MRIQTDKIKEKLIIFPRFLAKHSFSTFFILFIVSLILGGVIFYLYVISIERIEIAETRHKFLLKEDTYKEVLRHWEERDIKFIQADSKQYIDPFLERGIDILPATSTEEIATTTKEESVSSESAKKLLRTTTIFQFYLMRDGRVPSLQERAVIWEEKGLGSREGYIGSTYQNNLLLVELKKELTE